MTTSFRAKFPASAIKNLRVFMGQGANPIEWAKRESSELKVGDIVVCFNPANLSNTEGAELDAAALILVFNTTNQSSPMGILLTDDFYVIGTTETIFRERAVAATARGNHFSFVTIPFTSSMNEDAKAFVRDMQRWGSGGNRANPMNNLPDPLVAFFACVGAPLPASPVLPITTMSQALIRRLYSPEISDLAGKYGTVLSPEHLADNSSIASVTVIETPGENKSSEAQQKLDENKRPADKPPISNDKSAKADPVLPGSEKKESTDSPAEPAESGFLSIRKRLEARLAGKLPKGPSTPTPGEAPARVEPVSPVVKLVSNIRQQMSIASDNLEYRVSTLKSKMLDRLVSCKHNLSEKEQSSLKALEDLRAQMQMKLEGIANQAKEDLSRCASKGTAQVRGFQSVATSKLADVLADQEQQIALKTEEAKRKVNESLSATKDELNKTVSRAQHTLRGAVTTTEVNLNQVINNCAESMEERIEGFRAQTNILAEGIGLSVESLGEAAKLQAQQSEEEVMKRLELLSEESLKSLREQSVRAEMECSKLIDKLSRDKLVPTLQDKRKIVVELSAFFQDEFSGVMQELIENRLAEFEPIVRSNTDACATALQDFKSRWTSNLEQHQKDLDEMETKLKDKVEEHLNGAKSRIDSMHDITRVTDHVLTSPELLRTRDETCLKFDIIAREHVSRAYSQTGDKIQLFKQESLDELTELRENGETILKNRGEETRAKIRNSIKNAMQRIQDLQTQHTA